MAVGSRSVLLLCSYRRYTGTTQLPVKAFRGDLDFAKACLPTVQPNVDLGMLALCVTYLTGHIRES